MGRRTSILALTAVLGLAAGCGETDDSTPVACLEGTGAYLRALGDAPGPVELASETPISDCLTKNQSGGELATVGAAMVGAATRLNGEARGDPGGEANLRLGYLLGAAERGAEGTGGIHTDLLRRLEGAALYSPADRSPSATFLITYRRGVEAGRRQG